MTRGEESLPGDLENALGDAYWRDVDGREARLEALLARYPDHEAALRARIEAWSVMPALPETEIVASARTTAAPDTIGPYRVLSELGEGGMGTVYLAEQTEPLRRDVALKLIKVGMDTRSFLRRFETERQALAMMEHSCIAKVFDAGATGSGRPYYVMEYVRGETLTAFCDGRRLGVEARLRLFQRICSGVQHAHSKGIIHRDLKPSNILVAEQDADAVPKIIDFGLARATEPELVGASLSEPGQIMGTPEYMSPEQAGLEDLDVDSRTDVYSLGVILYELLVGEIPFHRSGGASGTHRLLQQVREEDPERPSLRATRSSGAGSTSGRSPSSLGRRLQGDLDWIVLKALEKDRARRYQTPLELASDIERHLSYEPVSAGPPSATYRLQKLARKYRTAFVAGLLVFTTAVVGALIAWVYALEARDQEAVARREADRFDRLAVRVDLDDALAEAELLTPAWPERIAEMNAWLRRRARPLALVLEDVRVTMRELESSARATVDPSAHPRHDEFAALAKAMVPAFERADAVRRGEAEPVRAPLPDDLPGTPLLVAGMARLHIDPERQPEAHGNEALGLALARHAVASAGERVPTDCRDTLAWALHANGLDDAAKAEMGRAYPLWFLSRLRGEDPNAPPARLRREIAAAPKRLAEARARLAELEVKVAAFRRFEFADESDRFLYETLQRVESELQDFIGADGAVVRVRRLLRWATALRELVESEPVAEKWTEARAAILRADGVTASALYRDHRIDLAPQTGLVPIGMNPRSQLWEFYHLRSAWTQDIEEGAAAIPIPTHEDDGSIPVLESTGIVFVLIPGGTFTMGAQRRNRRSPGYDPEARKDEMPHRVTLAPFFLARHELTQGQWHRLAGELPSGTFRPGFRANFMTAAIDPRHPVEMVDWNACRALADRFGLEMPTEAQWEYACRAGRPKPDLAREANVLDQTARRGVPSYKGEHAPFDDHYCLHSPVGTFAANPFGLYDVHGNVWEWCRDWRRDYANPVSPGDGERLGWRERNRVSRGGAYDQGPGFARAAYRDHETPETQRDNRGFRSSRRVLPAR